MFFKIEKIKLKDIKFHRFTGLNKKSIINRDYNWDLLSKSIKKEGYNPIKYGYITLSKTNFIFDGHHRWKVLYDLYGEEYEIEVKISAFYYSVVIPTVIFLHLIFLPFLLGKKMFKAFKGFKH